MKARYKWSISDWHQLVDTGILADKSVELLEGEIVEMSPEGIPHSYTNDSVAEYLRNKLKDIAKVRESHPVTLDNVEELTQGRIDLIVLPSVSIEVDRFLIV